MRQFNEDTLTDAVVATVVSPVCSTAGTSSLGRHPATVSSSRAPRVRLTV